MGDGVRYIAVHAVAVWPAGGDTAALEVAVASALGCAEHDGSTPHAVCPMVLFGTTVTRHAGLAVAWLRAEWDGVV
jgi:hypothetical protein